MIIVKLSYFVKILVTLSTVLHKLDFSWSFDTTKRKTDIISVHWLWPSEHNVSPAHTRGECCKRNRAIHQSASGTTVHFCKKLWNEIIWTFMTLTNFLHAQQRFEHRYNFIYGRIWHSVISIKQKQIRSQRLRVIRFWQNFFQSLFSTTWYNWQTS